MLKVIKKPEMVEYLELNKVQFDLPKKSQQLLYAFNDCLPSLKYLIITESKFCPGFIGELKKFLDINSSLFSFSMVMNRISEEEMLIVVEASLNHPNLEIL